MKNLYLIALSASLLAGCAAIPLQPNAAHVIVSTNPAPHDCKYLGQVVGNQGNFFIGGFTSNENLELGAMNDLKNKAGAMGANYVQMITNRAGITGAMGSNGGSMEQTNVTSTGNAYDCPPASIGQ